MNAGMKKQMIEFSKDGLFIIGGTIIQGWIVHYWWQYNLISVEFP
jgi:hypothetical protein